jgi:hypothetical protein
MIHPRLVAVYTILNVFFDLAVYASMIGFRGLFQAAEQFLVAIKRVLRFFFTAQRHLFPAYILLYYAYCFFITPDKGGSNHLFLI